MLKKQTVWLLTMLSLMVVLSVYYLNAPSEGDLAYMDNNQEEGQETSLSNLEQPANNDETPDESGDVDVEEGEELGDQEGTSVNADEFFTAVRLEITNQRSMERERLQSIVASSESSSDEKNEAYEAMKEMETLSSKESILEDTIKSVNGYDEVLVRNVSDNNLVITVQTDSLTKAEANEIMQHAKDEFGEIKVDVSYQPS
ncbi:SpoIIIAH-like family protein [Gracilibacillus sp. S3-1-1]|uniref:SpoIIIAH-like family protein n=1 Tax=Gracilibacillus pellucidus TaxID=3095368 RepID=A0ACC6M511_9BACI|nr:SpoIIIAH-like family protein [Gracilibacillus sp. S3-1-1]MDX8046024.1 SpoIIIAH-like family protein [Gracilibacillus sp. S3-1-1]